MNCIQSQVFNLVSRKHYIMADQGTNCDMYCVECNPPKLFRGPNLLNDHYKQKHEPLESCGCAFLQCKKRFIHRTSMIRHFKTFHKGPNIAPSSSRSQPTALEAVPSTSTFHEEIGSGQYGHASGFLTEDDDDDDRLSVIVDGGMNASPNPPANLEEEVRKKAIQLLIDLRSTASLTGKAIERFETGCNTLLQQFSTSAKAKLSESLKEKGMSDAEISDVLRHLDVDNPFKGLRTIEEQLKYFSENFGLVMPEEKLLDTRIDRRLDSSTNTYIQCQVFESFQYISIIATLKAIVANKKYRDLLMKSSGSTDGVIRSHMDGSRYKNHAYIQRHKFVIHILLFFDELEVTNSLGSKTIIHKLAAFFYQILNFPPEISSELSSIFLVILAYADDLKKEGAMDRVLIPLVQELNKLASEEGVPLGKFDGEEFILRAVIVAVTADTLAAHDLLGFLGPGARHFCRWCMVTRQEIRANANATGARRIPELHRHHLQQVALNKKFSTQCGVKESCRLDKIPHFSCVEGNVFDCFHDLLEGIVPLIVKLVLRHYIVVKKLLTVTDFNVRVESFSYGIPDSKNKPSPNFTKALLSSSKDKIKQTGSQMWCLIRALPFLLKDFVNEVDEHLQLIFLLQDIMQIIFSFEIKESDITSLEDFIYQHNELFFKLFIAPSQNVDQETLIDYGEDMNVIDENEDVDGDLEEVGDTEDTRNEEAQAVPTQASMTKGVHVTNKLHHLTHYPDQIREFGNPVRMWCAKFEGRLKIFRQHSSICCNFKNIPKTMARMFQLSNLKSLINDQEELYLEHQRGNTVKVSNSPYKSILNKITDQEEVIFTNSATLHGEDYRPGLFVAMPSSNREPLFCLIKEVVLAVKEVILIVAPWKNLGVSYRYHTYEVVPETGEEKRQAIAIKTSSLASHRCVAPWTANANEIFLSPRTVLL
ncbi:FERM domain-containing protein 1 [Frankliniella fusca]|uniref:FERM domain-containing protein 1 n=1 Tax=Frankliniella fusca TaxID=407009 RepID=A0AAE1HVJ0_9NEOP|nr:FERM domain-containing protein 1 [Frankliniella fusca]